MRKERAIWRGNEVPVLKREETRVVILTPCLIYLEVYAREVQAVARATRAKRGPRRR